MILLASPALFKFARPELLWLLALLPALFSLYLLVSYNKRKLLKEFGDVPLVMKLLPDASPARRRWKLLLQLSAYFFLIFALAGPQFGSKLEEVKRQGVEIIIALDVSQSMLAEDIKPSRLRAAKRAITQLVKKLSNDKLGLIVFAGDAYTQVPITADYGAIKMFLSTVNTDIVPKQGTNIGAAIDLALKSFSPDEEVNKALIIITDGEDHDEKAVKLAETAAEKGIVVHTIGMGLPRGGPIPTAGSYGQKDFKKDKQGSVIITKLNAKTLQDIAKSGQGTYLRASNSVTGLSILFDKINEMEKAEFESRIYSDYDERFQWLLGVALLLLLVDMIVLPRRSKYFKGVNLFEKRMIE